MIRNYIKIAWRNLIKNKSFTFINLLGLATGFAIALLIIQYARFELSYENGHLNKEQLVRLTTDYMDGESVAAQDCETNPPLGLRIYDELSEVINYTRAYPVGEPSVNITIGERNFVLEKLYAVDSSFFSMFTYPLIHGTTKNIFIQPNEAVISKKIALAYFNKTNVIGETIEMPASKGSILLNVVGVATDPPPNTHLKFDMLISYPTMLKDPILLQEYGETEDNWNGNNTITYVQLAKNASYDKFTTSLDEFNKRLQIERESTDTRFISQKIGDIHLYSNKTFEVEPNGSAKSVYLLLGVALLVIISAFVNYINLATSKALDRAKEVGIRKVVGSTKNQLRIQFLLESFIVNLLAAIFASLLILLISNKFIELAAVPAEFQIFSDSFFWIMLTGFTFLGVLLSGVYPAFVLSSFKPASILKGNFAHSVQGELLRKSLVVFQFAITIILLVQIFTVNSQLDYLKNIDTGVDIDQTIVVVAPSQNKIRQNYNVFKQRLLENPSISNVSVSGAVPGQLSSQFSTTTGINLAQAAEKHNYNFYLTVIDSDYIPLLGMNILAGENFNLSSKAEKKEVIVNEEAIKLWKIPNAEAAVGKILKFWGNEWTIKAVVQNHHQESAKSPYMPIIYRYWTNFESLASIRFVGTNPKDQVAMIKDIYEAEFPGAPFTYFFMDQEFNKQFKEENRFQSVFMVLTGFSILIACLGLFGLAMFTVSKRQKEIGVRKVLGASVANILILLSSSFLKIISFSVLIGLPITYLLANNWLDNFAFRIELNWWLFTGPILLMFLLVIISISINTIGSALTNPANVLKDE